MSNFYQLRNFGGNGESIFKEDFIDYFKIPYKDVRDNIIYRKLEVDYIINGDVKIEIKTTNSTNYLYFLEYKLYKKTNEIKTGWFYYSNSNFFVFVLIKTRKIIFLKRTDEFYIYYEKHIKNKYKLIEDDQNTIISYYRKVPIKSLRNFIVEYQRYI
ncbi:MAG: hypothetical protein KatS3mg096_595 [Candidatus Parcubacteria bacterium]|nr:MAG: hypothetical protein KatS3mg096_595 [Candidatus Parcubacteria bacterium]